MWKKANNVRSNIQYVILAQLVLGCLVGYVEKHEWTQLYNCYRNDKKKLWLNMCSFSGPVWPMFFLLTRLIVLVPKYDSSLKLLELRVKHDRVETKSRVKSESKCEGLTIWIPRKWYVAWHVRPPPIPDSPLRRSGLYIYIGNIWTCKNYFNNRRTKSKEKTISCHCQNLSKLLVFILYCFNFFLEQFKKTYYSPYFLGGLWYHDEFIMAVSTRPKQK